VAPSPQCLAMSPHIVLHVLRAAPFVRAMTVNGLLGHHNLLRRRTLAPDREREPSPAMILDRRHLTLRGGGQAFDDRLGAGEGSATSQLAKRSGFRRSFPRPTCDGPAHVCRGQEPRSALRHPAEGRGRLPLGPATLIARERVLGEANSQHRRCSTQQPRRAQLTESLTSGLTEPLITRDGREIWRWTPISNVASIKD
jgi:hypothetical protein